MTDKLKEYEILQKKYKLPSFKQLDEQFDIETLETDFLLRYLRKRISEFLDSYVNVLEDTMHPDSSLSALYEYKIFDDTQKETLFIAYKKLMKLLRYSLEASLVNSEAEDANFIKESFSQWRAIRKLLLPLVKQLKDSWGNEVSVKEDLGYLG